MELTGLSRALQRFIDRYAPRLDFAVPYWATVVLQQADGSVDLRPDPVMVNGQQTNVLPDLTAVPVLYGVPGCTATFSPGARVLVEFAAADPALPFVRSWAAGATVTQIVLDAERIVLGDPASAILGVLVSVPSSPVNATSPGGPLAPVTRSSGRVYAS